MRLSFPLFVGLICSLAADLRGAVPDPLWYYDGTHRYLKLTLADFGKTYVEVRSVGAPGEASKWIADGDRKEKEITFARSVGGDELRGTFYAATFSDASFKVKIKPGQDKTMQDEGIIGQYHRLSDEKRQSLAKHEFEAAEKRLADAYKMIFKTVSDADKPALAEIKQRWSALRERIVSLGDKPKSAPETKSPIGSSGKAAAGSPEFQADRLIQQSTLTAGQIAFVNAKADAKTKSGWEGDYNDGFGGSVNILQENEGKIRFTLNCSRGSEDQAGTLSGTTTPKMEGKTLIAEFVDNNSEVKDPALQTRIHLRRSGHYLFIESNQAGRYSGRGWFDGVYRKQPPPPAPE